MPQATVNDLKKHIRRYMPRCDFHVLEDGKFTQTVHGKRSLRTCVAVISNGPVADLNPPSYYHDRMLAKWFKVDVSKWLQTFPIPPNTYRYYTQDFVDGRPLSFANEDDYTGSYNGSAVLARLGRELFYDRTGGMVLIGSLNRWGATLYPYIYFHNEMDAMYFVVDHGLTTK